MPNQFDWFSAESVVLIIDGSRSAPTVERQQSVELTANVGKQSKNELEQWDEH
jgi:hypothetical protein